MNQDTSFPERGGRLCVVYREFRIDIIRHIHPTRFYLTIHDHRKRAIAAIREAMPQNEVYPIAFKLLEVPEEFDETPEVVKIDTSETIADANPDYQEIIAAPKAGQTVGNIERFSINVPGIGKKVLTAAAIHDADDSFLDIQGF